MRHLSRYLLPCLVALFALVSCGQSPSGGSSTTSQNACEKTSNVRGTITSIKNVITGNFVGSFLLNGTKEQQATFDLVVVRVTSTTQVFEKQGTVCRSLSFANLKQGQRLQIQTTGTTLQSYPPQVEATEIVILSGV